MGYTSRHPYQRSKGLSTLEEWLLGKRRSDRRGGTFLPLQLGAEAYVHRCNRLCWVAGNRSLAASTVRIRQEFLSFHFWSYNTMLSDRDLDTVSTISTSIL